MTRVIEQFVSIHTQYTSLIFYLFILNVPPLIDFLSHLNLCEENLLSIHCDVVSRKPSSKIVAY